jgi:flagellar M-ring protein FliF
MEMIENLRRMFRDLSVSQRASIGAALLVVLIAGAAFASWVVQPTYTVLYSDIDASQLSQVTDQLQSQNIPYRLEGAGSRVLVPQSQVYQARADLAAQGIQGAVVPVGYELLDDQGISVSDFRQRVDYQRALEGELARTLTAMTSVDTAMVHLVIPEEALFVENQEPVTASVLLDTAPGFGQSDIDAITYLVSSSVEGLEANQVTVASTDGTVLHAAGEDEGVGGASNRQLRLTHDFEAALTQDLTAMLATMLGPGRASVVVRAEMDFDERTTESETYTPESATPIRQQTIDETLNGAGTSPVGSVGVDGEAIEIAEDGAYDYQRREETVEYGIDRTVVRTLDAPGTINWMSVAVVVDDGSITGATAPDTNSLNSLVAAAAGIQPERGDVIEVSAIPFPAASVAEPIEAVEEPSGGVMDMIPTIVGGLVMVVVAVALFLMSRGGKTTATAQVVAAPVGALNSGTAPAGAALGQSQGRSELTGDVLAMVERQPEEIASLLRSWLADRRESEVA